MKLKTSSFILVIIWIGQLDTINCIGNGPSEKVISGIENATSSCDDGWLLVPGYGCFLFDMENKLDWLRAQAYCQVLGGYLPEKIDSDLQEFLIEYTLLISGETEVSSWLGATDIGNERHWIWMHSDTEVTQFFWCDGCPSGSTFFNCLYLHAFSGNDTVDKATGWDDMNCDGVDLSVVCQKLEK